MKSYRRLVLFLTVTASLGIAVVSLAQEKPKITGQNLLSIFSITKVKGAENSLSPDIPDESGKLQKGKGMLWKMSTIGVSGEQVSTTITDGFVWTPRAINLGKIDLTVEGKITDLKDFDWESFKNADEVIAFANGYGVNLFGAKIKAGAISSPGVGCYLTDDGRRLPARLITETKTAGRTTLEEMILEAPKKATSLEKPAAKAAGLVSAGRAEAKVIKVLMTTGDWKSQAWYQDVWMANGGAPKLYRGRYIQKRVEEAAPGQFEFTHVPNSIAQQHFDADYLSQFDVVVIGDIMVHLSDKFQKGVNEFVKNGGGLLYCANHKWPQGMEVKGQAFEECLPCVWPNADANGVWQEFVGGSQPIVVAADHPVVKLLLWAEAPGLGGVANMPAKKEATVLLKVANGAPLLTAWDFGKGRAIFSASIFSNDEQSEGFANWKDFGKYYAQVFTWLGEKSTNKKADLKDASAKVSATVDFTKPLNKFSTGLFSIHGAEGIDGEGRKNFDALNLKGAFHRFDINPEPEKGKFNFGSVDHGIGEAQRSGLEPLPLLSPLSYGEPKWLWAKQSWGTATEEEANEVAEMVAATLEHTNHGKKGSPGYQPVIKYIEIANEPDIKANTIAGYVNIIKAVGARVHRDFPGVKVGAYCPYHPEFINKFIDQCGGSYDWLSFHPYGWSPDVLFPFLEGVADYAKKKGHPTEILITEWDFWIAGREKFDYMMLRNFEAVKYDNVITAVHYRLWQYQEPIYMFGVLWEGWGVQGIAQPKGTPMHDSYDAFWIWRDFRGERVAADTKLLVADVSEKLLDHVHVSGSVGQGKADTVLYYDWAYGGTGFKDFAKGINYSKVQVDLKLVLPASDKERTVTISKATGEGFEIIKKDIKVPAGQKEFTDTIEIAPLVGISVTVE